MGANQMDYTTMKNHELIELRLRTELMHRINDIRQARYYSIRAESLVVLIGRDLHLFLQSVPPSERLHIIHDPKGNRIATPVGEINLLVCDSLREPFVVLETPPVSRRLHFEDNAMYAELDSRVPDMDPFEREMYFRIFGIKGDGKG